MLDADDARFVESVIDSLGDERNLVLQSTTGVAGLTLGGALLIAIGAALPALVLSERIASLLIWSLVASGYGFVVALPYGAAVGMRGLEPVGPASNLLVFIGNTIGVLGSLVGALLFTWGAWRAGRSSS